MTPDGAGSVTIRPARADDYDRILSVWQAAGLGISQDGRDGKPAFTRQVEHFAGLYLVAEEGDRLVGVVLGTHDLRKGWINRVAVLPAHRRRGIASRLVRACDQAIRALGIEIVAALVEPDNTSSLALFQKLGYRTDIPAVYFRKPSREGA